MSSQAFEHAAWRGGPPRDRRDLAKMWRAMAGEHGHGRGRGRGRGRDYGWRWGGGDFPFGEFGPGGPPFGRGRKARRGDIRTAALLLLAEEPRNGYQIMQEVQDRSEGVWRPSPGSVYPALAQLEDEGLIRSEEFDGRKLFAITDDGRAQLAQRDSDAPAPWEQFSGGVSDEAFNARHQIRDVALAFMQVIHTGSDAQITKAREILDSARRDLYRVLADGDDDSTADPQS
ncbi:MAG TPA: PadR family transcriptional regulator [Solirubrobacteraceae bacterium]|nr:PadR family transcriptional regulator [Solirubrobacteraceae bacterium]